MQLNLSWKSLFWPLLWLLLRKILWSERGGWVKEWLARRQEYTPAKLLNEMKLLEPTDFQNYFRISRSSFEVLLNMVAPLLMKMYTNMWEKVACNASFSGDRRLFDDLKFSAKVSPVTISGTTAGLWPSEAVSYVKRLQKFETRNIHLLFWLMGTLKDKHETIVNESKMTV